MLLFPFNLGEILSFNHPLLFLLYWFGYRFLTEILRTAYAPWVILRDDPLSDRAH